MREVYGIAAFRSRQQVMHFEDALRREGLNVGVVTTPRAVAMGCGLSVRFNIEDADRVKWALRRMNPGNLIGLYRVEQGGVRPVITPIAR
ncbi:MAG: DUF3343 domain-containing protein [Clostridia bacterium]|nr:DUF3343 domain-containing protein [Clostridia bacterium]